MTDISEFHTPRGGIRNQQAYARGKMLDHSAWQQGEKVLPRNITASDVDMCFDNGGKVILGEVTSEFENWLDLAKKTKGQFLLYANLIEQTHNCAALCKHSVPVSEGKLINTRRDFGSFQIMTHEKDEFYFTDMLYEWERFVFEWYENPEIVREKCIKNGSLREAREAIKQDKQFEYITQDWKP